MDGGNGPSTGKGQGEEEGLLRQEEAEAGGGVPVVTKYLGSNGDKWKFISV